MKQHVKEAIQDAVEEHPVVLFMKGTPTFPQCGFSARVVAVLEELGTEFAAVNVLESSEVREGIKEFGNWPTIPQLWVAGELVGGCDIVREMHADGDLEPLIDAAVAKRVAPVPAG